MAIPHSFAVTGPVPTPEEEDRRRISRERRTLTAERVQHVNRIKGLLFSQGITYEPLHRNRRQRLEELRTGDGRPLPEHLKRQISRELDRLELELAEARAAYDDAGELASLASLRGARHPHTPIISRGPYGRRPGEHEAAERLAWGKAAA